MRDWNKRIDGVEGLGSVLRKMATQNHPPLLAFDFLHDSTPWTSSDFAK